MSSGSRNLLPAFGISRRNRVTNENSSSTSSAQMKIPVRNLYVSDHDTRGELVLNSADDLLYYFTGVQWLPLSPIDPEIHNVLEFLTNLISLRKQNVTIEAPDSGNLHLIAGNSRTGNGGHVHVSTGKGGYADGEIYFDVGGESALTIRKTGDLAITNGDVQVESGNVVVKNGNLELVDPAAEINCVIQRASIESTPESLMDADEETEQNMILPNVTLNGMTSILTIGLNLVSGKNISGTINNSLLQKDSWVNVSVVNGGEGCPYVWLSKPDAGVISYNIHSLDGTLTELELHIEIRNSY